MKYKKSILFFMLGIISLQCYSQFNTISDEIVSSPVVGKVREEVRPPVSEVDSTRLMEIISLYTSVAYPLDNMTITSAFGKRYHPIDKKVKLHNGLDLRANHEDVYAMRNGYVKKQGNNSSAGNYVIIEQEDGVSVSYCHLSKIYVKRGEKVIAGQVVAKSGNTGKSTGPHLHLVTRKAGKYIDPFDYLQEIMEIRRNAFRDYARMLSASDIALGEIEKPRQGIACDM